MERGAKHQHIFEQSPSGLLVQSGSTSEFWNQDSASYAAAKDKALRVDTLLRANGLLPQQSPTLARLIADTTELSDAWLCDKMSTVTFRHLMSALQINRIAQAVAVLGVDGASKLALSGLLNGSIDLLGRKQSKAKDTLWELELLQLLSNHGIRAAMAEPDILMSFNGPALGVACKKLYSEANVSKVLSRGVAQIERDAEFGILALNLDDLLPANALLQAPSIDVMSTILTGFIFEFLHRHERYLRRYLEPGRALSVVASCAVIADIPSTTTRFFSARQSVAWTVPGLAREKEEQMTYFLEAFKAKYPTSG